MVDDVTTVVKNGRSKGSMQDRSKKGRLQARNIIIDVRNHDMSQEAAESGLGSIVSNYGADLDRVTVIGDVFTIC